MERFRYFEWVGGDLLNEHFRTLRMNAGCLVQIFDETTKEWRTIPSDGLLERLDHGALDMDEISSERAAELTGSERAEGDLRRSGNYRI